VTALTLLVGVLLILAVFTDAFRTVLLPTSTAPVTNVVARGLWRAARRVPARHRPPALRSVGPTALVLTLVAWLAGLLVGFALVYLPAVEGLAYSADVHFADRGFPEALYLSGAALTTLGFGDVVGQSVTIRLLTFVEAASGLGVLAATFGYLPAIYTIVSNLRSSNQTVADLGADHAVGAAELLGAEATRVLDMIRLDVIAARQHLQRFPVLHYFHFSYDESVVALARGGIGLWVAAHFANDATRPLDLHVRALEMALRRLVDELPHRSSHTRPDLKEARQVFERARAASIHPDAAREGTIREDTVALLAHLCAVLDVYAGSHDYPVPKVRS